MDEFDRLFDEFADLWREARVWILFFAAGILAIVILAWVSA